MSPRHWLLLPVLAGLVLAGCGSSPSPSATRLAVTDSLSAALLAAGAANHDLPTSDFTGLAAGATYYAWDAQDHLYWAGAQLVPSPHSMRAQVSVQDDGAYDLYTKPKGGSWTAFEDGLGTVPGTNCAIVVPKAVRKVWHWSTSTPCGGPPPPTSVH